MSQVQALRVVEDAKSGDCAPAGKTVQAWMGRDISDLCRSPDLLAVYDRWRTLGTTKLPRLNEMLGPDQQTVANSSMVLMKLPNDLVFVHHGSVAVRTMGRDFTGVLHSELKSAVAEEIQSVYLEAINKAQATYIRYVSQISTQHFSFEQIAVPLASDESREPKLLLVRVAPLDDKSRSSRRSSIIRRSA
ncbi:MAG TPA: hypothetical protein VFB45_11740 [Pseudolabrys sp.]|nr:hypothetical protein [Pseudolabrys sp.]